MVVFADERLVPGACPLLVLDRPGDPERPTVVFLPGALHTARIGYGLSHDRPSDFLAHWIGRAGHSFVGLSYPVAVGDPIFESIDGSLRLDQMTAAMADEVVTALDRNGSIRQVIVAAWSALGNTPARLRADLAERGVELVTFIGLAATPPLPNLILGSLEASEATVGRPDHYDESGLLLVESLRSESFRRELDRIDADLGRTVIDRDDYRQHHLGDMPLEVFPGLEASGLEASGPTASVTIGHARPLEVSAGARWADYPLCGSVAPTLASDRRHVLTDRHNWAMVTANAVHWRVLAGVDTGQLDPARWAAVADLSHRLCNDLHRTVAGGHFFFVGEPGARATARAILDVDAARDRLQTELTQLLAD